MGRYLYKYFTEKMNIKLDKRTFVLWNVMPDIAPSLLKLSHFKKDIYDLVMEKAKYLALEGDSLSVEEYSRHLAILCHFMCDFFCYAHSEDFDGSKVGHLAYELKMQVYGYRSKSMLHAIDLINRAASVDHSQALYEQINELHAQYSEHSPSYGNDFIYSLTACVDLALNMLDQQQREPLSLPA